MSRRSLVLLFCSAVGILTALPTIAGTPSPFAVTVDSAAVGPKFVVYLGGGDNISPPAPVGGGGGVPLLSFSNNGPAFMAGEVSSKDANTRLIRITFTVRNTAHDAASFKIGDVGLAVGSERWNDFMAVGYDTQLCAMGDEDRKKVKEIVVTVRPGEARQLSVIFPLTKADSKQGELLLGSAAPATFQVSGR
jgi:hypothetical protein